MSRIELPGEKKTKKIILIALVILAILVLIFEGIKNYKKTLDLNDGSQEKKIESLDSQQELISIKKENNDKNDKEQLAKEDERETLLYNEAYKFFFSHEYDSAIDKANEIIVDFPNSAKGYNIRGISKAYNGSFDYAMRDIDKALDIEPNYGYAIFNKALTYELYNKFDEALLWYNKDLEVENYVWTYYGIASIYGRRGDAENTIIYLKKAIDIDEAVKNEAKAEADFDPVRDLKEFKELIR
ncbi:tetratricopeptide repeat protein [Clostridium uliginosum]|uniref:Tetratricopeptide repeat-containing protein n=1 Tax=Clostridium uliginosum TaxID=119641 RepID=A0A1I1MAQ9_9CLOT|nr:hypothetical protein [Clostridium uliginosum]SFC82547.1 hypothetical protein SAMN05421842_11092 [Clostridium uliginosum]